VSRSPRSLVLEPVKVLGLPILFVMFSFSCISRFSQLLRETLCLASVPDAFGPVTLPHARAHVRVCGGKNCSANA